MIKIGCVVAAVLLGFTWAQDDNASNFINDLYTKGADIAHKIAVANWEVATNENANKEELQKELSSLKEQFDQLLKDSHEGFKGFDWKSFSDEKIRRMFFIWSDFGDNLLSPEDKTELNNLVSSINQLEGDVKIKEFPDGQELNFKDTVKKYSESYDNAEALKHYWVEGYNQMGRPAKEKFIKWLDLKGKTAEANGFGNILDYWQGVAEIDDYENTFVPLLTAIQPFFNELHAYFRHKLQALHGDAVGPNAPIPDSLLVQMWTTIIPDDLWKKILPFPDVEKQLPFDVSQALNDQGIRGRAMVEKIDGFFQSLGYDALSSEFLDKSVFDKNEKLGCNSNAFDFADNSDYRMNVCAEPTQVSFLKTTESVTFTKWQQAFKDQPHFFKAIPNTSTGTAGFSTVQSFITSPKYLKTIGLLDQNEQVSTEMETNFLFKEAMTWVFGIPYLVAYDMWRWHVIKGETQPDNYNCEYWNLRSKYQGVEPPVDRDNNDFDQGGNLFAIRGNQLVEKVISRFMKYDMISELCKTAGYNPDPNNPESHLAFCDISESKEAGEKLREAMKLGSSVPFYKVLGRVTGRDSLDSAGLLEYYKPLEDWLKKYNDDNNVPREWSEQSKCH